MKRISDLSPDKFCDKHLKHQRMLIHRLVQDMDKDGRWARPDITRWRGHMDMLAIRHAVIVSEMDKRGLKHTAPFPGKVSGLSSYPEHTLTPEAELVELKKCADCEKRLPVPAVPDPIFHVDTAYGLLDKEAEGGTTRSDRKLGALRHAILEGSGLEGGGGGGGGGYQYLGQIPLSQYQQMQQQIQQMEQQRQSKEYEVQRYIKEIIERQMQENARMNKLFEDLF